ncbi:MAG: thiamine phosphate synthase [Verrucomicrobia bacterium]|nr:thiamine phosphate synthase [Verrucomicrobiota bacterium]
MGPDELRTKLEEARLYAFVDAAYLNGRQPTEVTRALCDGGADIIQLRAKGLMPDEVRRMAEAIAPIIKSSGALMVVNDHPDIAVAVGAPLCHLGQEDFFEAGHSKAADVTGVPPRFGLGLSTHSPSQAEKSIGASPDYIAIGPVFATGTKPTAPPVTLEYVRWASANLKVPWFAIGGIDLGTLSSVLEAGARRICVVSSILNSRDISGACQAFRNRLVSASR